MKKQAPFTALPKDGMRYVRAIPKALPRNRILVHNFPPGYPRGIGMGGFRLWVAARGQMWKKPCGCDWAPDFAEHFTTYRARSVKELRMQLQPRWGWLSGGS